MHALVPAYVRMYEYTYLHKTVIGSIRSPASSRVAFIANQTLMLSVSLERWEDYIHLIIMELGRIFVHTNLQNWPKNSQRTQMKLLNARPGGDLDGHFHHELAKWKFSDNLPMLNYRAPSWFYEEITEFAQETVVRELLLGHCCNGLFAIVAVSCMRLWVL